MMRQVAVFLAGVLCSAAAAKSGKTYFTPERVGIARDNVDRHEWARRSRDRIIETGDRIRYYIGPLYTSARQFAAQSDEFFWALQPSTTIPRVYDLGAHPRAECPLHGTEVKKHNAFNPWRIDPIEHPYQIQCPVGGEWYPSNRYDLGDLTSGDFPDDGTGCVYNGKRYHFLVEYVHMVYGSVVVPTLKSLSEAYVLTGDATYARKGCILMARLATQYPNYGWEGTDFEHLEDRTERTYLGPFGGTHPFYTWKQGGLVTDLIWENFMLERIAYAYDGLYDAFDDPGVLAFVRSRGMPVETGDDLRRYIEDYILRAGMVALLREKIKGNEGHHQACAMALALVLDDYADRHPNSADMVDYAYLGAGRTANMIANGLTRDGGGHESPNYNTIKLDFIRTARLMEIVRARYPDRFPVARYPDIFAEAKGRELFHHLIDSLILDYWLPPIGDCGALRKPRRVPPQRYSQAGADNLFAFLKYDDPRFARALTSMDGDLSRGELWEPYPSERIEAALSDPRSTITRRSRLLDGYGVGIFEAGRFPRNRAFVLNYSSIVGHRQMDQLSIGLYARGVDFLPDLGYPRTWNYRWEWDSHNLAHNTVTVNWGRFTRPRFFRNGCRLFVSQDGIHGITAHHNPYIEAYRLGRDTSHPCDLYERTDIMVEVDEANVYVVDLFAVNGGNQHDQSWHALYVEPEAPALPWVEQETGTWAGADIEEFAAFTDPWGRHRKAGDFPSFITEVRRAPLSEPGRWTWRSGLPEADGLALIVIPVDGPLQAIMGKGRSPVWVEDKLDFLFLQRQVQNGAPTRYLTILEPFQGEPVIQSVRLVARDPITVEIQRTTGIDEVIIHLPSGPSRTTAHRPLGFRVKLREGDAVVRDVAVGAGAGARAPGYAQGRIVALDYARQTITVAGGDLAVADAAPGRAVRIFNSRRTAMFTVAHAARTDEGTVEIELDKPALLSRFPVIDAADGRLELGERSPFVTGHVDEETGDPSDGPNDTYYGSWLGDAGSTHQVRGIINRSPTWLHLFEQVPAAELRARYVGKTVPIWYYGIGDLVEIVRVRSHSVQSP